MKSVIKYVSVFLVVVFIMLLVLTGVSLIPTTAIQEKSEESAEYLLQKDTHFYNFIDGSLGKSPYRAWDCSKVDQIADAILLSIAYYIDPDHPMESVLWANYYDGREDTASHLRTMNESYQRTVNGEAPANKQYLRYWHGSLIIVRPLLMILNLRQMKVVQGIVISALLVTLLSLLLKYGLKAEAVCFTIAMIAVSIWFVPLSLEYTWTFILMLIGSVLAVSLVKTGREEGLGMLFFLLGMTTAYFDFLTTETLSVLVPLLLVVRIGDQNKVWKLAGKCLLLWWIAYVGTWAAKWVISSITLKENVLPYVRWGAWNDLVVFEKTPTLQVILRGFLYNVTMLFPIGYRIYGGVIFFLLVIFFVFIPVYKGTVTLKRDVDRKQILFYLLLGMIVYVRFIVLRNHAYFHYFFTYRAQAATVLALCFIILELVQLNPRKAVMKDA